MKLRARKQQPFCPFQTKCNDVVDGGTACERYEFAMKFAGTHADFAAKFRDGVARVEGFLLQDFIEAGYKFFVGDNANRQARAAFPKIGFHFLQHLVRKRCCKSGSQRWLRRIDFGV